MTANKDKAAALAKAGSNKPTAEQVPEKRGMLSWVVGWLVLPAVVVGLIFGGGMMVGVHLNESWFTRLVLWIAGWM